MSIFDYRETYIPSGWKKIFYFNWMILLLVIGISVVGFLMLISVAGGDSELWMQTQIRRFGLSFLAMLLVAFIPISLWYRLAPFIYLLCLLLLLAVEIQGVRVMGAQRWIDLGFLRVQPSEFMKLALILMLAYIYCRIGQRGLVNIFWVFAVFALVLLPVAIVMRQPDLGTGILLLLLGGAIMFMAGTHLGYFATALVISATLIGAVFISKDTSWQLLKDYQYKRLDTFLDPQSDPLGAGYHITQSKIALGAGGWTGRGFMQGTQNQLNFLPEKHTDFIFTTYAEEFGFVGAVALIAIYSMIVFLGMTSALQKKDRFASLLTLGICFNFFLYFATNIMMAIGLIPVVGVPLPLVSYGGSSLLVIMVGIGFIQTAHIHRVRYRKW